MTPPEKAEAGARRRTLIVSSSPSARCGIARYAVQQALLLRDQGEQVDWASTDGGGEGVRYRLNLKLRTRDWVKLGVIAQGYDRILWHHQHDLYFTGMHPDEIAQRNLLAAALFATHPGVEIVVHEMILAMLAPKHFGRKIWWTERLKWSKAAKLTFHTQGEREQFLVHLPELEARCELKPHHGEMRPFKQLTQAQARAELALPPDVKIFLGIGFLQESKGYDRLLQAFRQVSSPTARLFLVGSVRDEHDAEAVRHAQLLRGLAAEDSRIKFIERFLSDEEFDSWVLAADVIVLPYRRIFSSGVAARARLFKKRLVVSTAGGLSEQLGPGDVCFDTETELELALESLAKDQPVPVTSTRAMGAGLRLAFVLPWYARDIPGGAEQQARKTMRHLVDAGVHVEVLTTCIQDYYGDWSVNARPEGQEVVDGIVVHRYPVLPRDAARFNAVAERAQRWETLTPADWRLFENEMIKSPALSAAIAEMRGRFDFFVFIPYMFATGIHGSRACPGQAVFIPCLHHDGYTAIPCYREMFTRARGIIFNTAAERALAKQLFPLSDAQLALTGEGLDTDWAGDKRRFREFLGGAPYLLFVGRRIVDKNFHLLLEFYRRYRDERVPELKLVTIGHGGFERFDTDGDSIVDLGVAPEQDKRDALAGSLAMCMPSVLESFSLSVMESWIARRPVLVHADCDVTRDHCVASGGGLFFRNYYEFAACVDLLLENSELADRMGEAGRRYVLENYEWSRVISRYLDAFTRWKAQVPESLEVNEASG